MFYYHILTNIKQTGILTFSSQIELDVGRVVSVKVRSRQVLGVIYSIASVPNFKTSEVVEVFNVWISQKTLKFINLFSFHTFQSINEVFNAYLPSLNILIKESNKNNIIFSPKIFQDLNLDDKSCKEFKGKDKNKLEKKNPVFILEKDMWFRIKYIIRSLRNDQGSPEYSSVNQNILFIFPEKAYIKKYYKKIEEILKDQEKEKKDAAGSDIDIHQFSPQSIKMSRNALASLYEPILQNKKELEPTSKHSNNLEETQNKPKINLILGTRSLLFLPYNNIHSIYFFEESDSSYIQEQNSLYFDTRDAIFYLSHVFNTSLTFISTLPSIRLLQFYSKEILKDNLSTLSLKDINSLKMQIYEQNYKDMFFNLFSNEILEQIGIERDEV